MFDIPPGVSDAAIITENYHAEIQAQIHQTASRYNHELESVLASVLKEGSSSNWLAEENILIETATIVMAKSFIESLPVSFQAPSIAPEPDGDLSIEWYKEKRRVLTASINSVGTIQWAALIGSEDPRGTVQFTGKAPDTILFYLTRILA